MIFKFLKKIKSLHVFYVQRFFLNLLLIWEKTSDKVELSFCENIFFKTLCFFEFFYKIFFLLIQRFKQFFYPPFRPLAKVISVGNLSVGGTGKSVFVKFLVQNLIRRCGILSRGYGRHHRDCQKAILVSDGKNIFCDARESGDEPFMLAQSLNVPLAVGANRVESFKILEANAHHNHNSIEVVILDDGYQNEQLCKDFQILLVDARRPIENGHCLPAGKLREKDFKRADIIIVTHSNLVSVVELQKIRELFFCSTNSIPIFYGMHRPKSLTYYGFENDVYEKKEHAFFACAGIGSFSSFLQTLKNLNIFPISSREFLDHHDYSKEDFINIVKEALKSGCSAIVTTEKDWVKLKSYVESYIEKELLWCVVQVEFEFLTEQEYHSFIRVVNEILFIKEK